jgi:Arm DNA-binding domain
MPVKKLTAVSLPHLPEGEWHDAILPGLILRVGKKRRSWSIRYHANGSYQRVALGHFPAMELGVARDAARAVIDRAERGLPAEAPQPHPRSADVLTLGALLDHYEKMRIREGTRIKALPRTQRLLRLHLRPYLALPVAQFDKAGLRAIRNELVVSGRPAAVNKLLTALSPCLRWAAAEDLIEVDFTSAIRRMPARARERKLTEQEIRAVWTASLNLGATETVQSYGRLVRFLLVTAQRRDEAASLRYGHVIDHNLEAGAEQGVAATLTTVAAIGARTGRSRRSSGSCLSRPPRQARGVLVLEAAARQGVWRRELGAARSAPNGRERHAGSEDSPRGDFGDPQSLTARHYRGLSAIGA